MKRMTACLLLIVLAYSLLGCNKESAADAKSFSSGKGGSLARFTISGNYLYTVDKQDLRVFSLANGAEPVLVRTVPVGFEIETIYPFKDKLFIGSSSVVHIFSIENPEMPKKLSEAISPQVLRRCDPVVAKDTVAYATLRTNGTCGGTQSLLVAFDIKDVTHPVQKFSFALSEPYGLGYADTVLYVCDHNQGLQVFNIAKPFQPRLVTTLRPGTFVDVIPYGDVLICWAREGLLLYDLTDKLHPSFIAKID